MLIFFYIHRINLSERRSPENNLSNLMRHRLNERHECYFGPQTILIESFLSSPNERQFMTSITST